MFTSHTEKKPITAHIGSSPAEAEVVVTAIGGSALVVTAVSLSVIVDMLVEFVTLMLPRMILAAIAPFLHLVRAQGVR